MDTSVFDPQQLPDNVIHNADVLRSESGSLQMRMTAPTVEQYSKPERKTVYPEGLRMQLYDNYNHPTAVVTARYAEQQDQRDIVLVRDSVVIIDLQSHDTTYLQELTWNRATHRIYSGKPLRQVSGERVTYGDAFESDDSLRAPRIIHQRGTIEWKDE